MALAKLPMLKLERFRSSTALKDECALTTEEKDLHRRMMSKPRRNEYKESQKALLKQQYENFNAISSESLDAIFNRLQKLVSRLLILGVDTSPEDLNVKFLRSLPSEWDTHVVKRTIAVNNDDKNLAFLTTSSPSILACFSDATVYAFSSTQPLGSELVHEDLEQIHDDEFKRNGPKWNMALLWNEGQKAPRSKDTETGIQGSSSRQDMAEMKIQANMGSLALQDSERLPCEKKCRPTPLDCTYSVFEEFKQPEINGYGPRDSSSKPTTVCDRESNNSKENTDDSLTQQPKSVTETSSVVSTLKVDKEWKEKFFHPANNVRLEEPKKARENTDAPIIEDWVSDDEEEVESTPKVEKKIPTATKKESVNTVKPSRRTVRYAEMYRSQRPRGNQRSWNGQKSDQLGCNFSSLNEDGWKKTIKNAIPLLVTVRSVNTARPVSTARQNVNIVRAIGVNAVKPSACWVWRPIKPNCASLSNSQLNDKGFVDSRCSRHMSGNIAHLSDFKDFDGGCVTFGGGANRGRITGKGTIKTDKLDFDDVYFVKELKFNLFSVS
ncbi:hypothetical protein Tco_0701017 [Tanacetum coccineum]